jgi:hypothetical protein
VSRVTIVSIQRRSCAVELARSHQRMAKSTPRCNIYLASFLTHSNCVTCHDVTIVSIQRRSCPVELARSHQRMAKSTRKTRVQTYHAKDLGSLKRKAVLLSNTSKRLRKVVTSVPIPASFESSNPQKCDDDNGLTETMVDESMDFYVDDNTNATSCTDFEHPAALQIRTRAKRYQNSVS